MGEINLLVYAMTCQYVLVVDNLRLPITTERLLLRAVRPTDVDALHTRRNDPSVGQWQSWPLPYAREAAENLVANVGSQPKADEWFMLTIADRNDTAILGDLALHLTWEGRCAEIGYSLGSDAWGHGFATEAVAAFVHELWQEPARTRIHAMAHPDNIASLHVLERTGFDYEGRTRLSYWVGDENSDDVIYGMTRNAWAEWQNRHLDPPANVCLSEITAENYRAVTKLETHKSQERFVAPVLYSYGDALVPEVVDGAPTVPWLRAVIADDVAVAFVMMAMITDAHPEPVLWRLLVDRFHQRRGIGTTCLDLLVGQCREWGASSMLVYWVPGRGSPEPVYRRYGFEPTGRIIDGETEGRLTF